MPLPGIRAAKSFLDELQRDLLEIEDQDFDGFFDRWSALGVPEIEEYRGDRRRSRGEMISEVNRTQRAIEKRPEILREAETDDSPILTGARRIARGADVLEGLRGNAGNGGPALIPISGSAPDATSFATPEFAPAAAPENSLDRTDFKPETGNTPRIDDGFAAGLNNASPPSEDHAEFNATVDAGAGMSEDEKREKCRSLQGQWIYWVRQNVAQTRELVRLDAEIEALAKQGEGLVNQILEHIGNIATPTRGDDSTDGRRQKSGQKPTGGGRWGKLFKFATELLSKAPEISETENKKESLNTINERIAALERKKGEIKSEQVVTRELIAYATEKSKRLDCPYDFSLGYPG